MVQTKGLRAKKGKKMRGEKIENEQNQYKSLCVFRDKKMRMLFLLCAFKSADFYAFYQEEISARNETEREKRPRLRIFIFSFKWPWNLQRKLDGGIATEIVQLEMDCEWFILLCSSGLNKKNKQVEIDFFLFTTLFKSKKDKMELKAK